MKKQDKYHSRNELRGGITPEVEGILFDGSYGSITISYHTTLHIAQQVNNFRKKEEK